MKQLDQKCKTLNLKGKINNSQVSAVFSLADKEYENGLKKNIQVKKAMSLWNKLKQKKGHPTQSQKV